MKKRPKSEKRQRSAQVNVRFTPTEIALLDRLRGSFARGPFLREKALGDAGARSQKAPPPNKQELGQILAQAGKIGSNVNQLAKRANQDGFNAIDSNVLEAAMTEISDIRAALMTALGRRGH